jgi:hypothetical protein
MDMRMKKEKEYSRWRCAANASKGKERKDKNDVQYFPVLKFH